ncbi:MULTISPECIES: hypothetical protein [Cyanobium]|uniref:hypothetical protein n=1 Tax=Cyanobium TaxID=167375 RepID=UPI000FCBCB4B|nr:MULTISPECIES: hypothetical protein [Cyanobium]
MHLLVEIGVKRNASLGATLVALVMHYAALCIIKTLEQERHSIDAVLLSTFGDAELRFGVRAPGGWVLKQRSRTSWEYDSEVRDANKGLQQQAQGGQIHLYYSRLGGEVKESIESLIAKAVTNSRKRP